MKKDLYHIKQLLSLYHSGMTTLAQEHELMEFFAVTPESALPDDMKADRRMMVLLAADGVCRVPAGLDAQLSAHIDMLERREHRGRRGRRLMAIASVAASVAILLTATVFVVKDSSSSVYELTDPLEAQDETQRALLLVSECLNKADRKAEETDMLLERLGFDMSMFEDDSMEYDDSLMTGDDGIVPVFSDTIGV